MLMTRRRVLAAKLETDKGGVVVPDVHILCYDPLMAADDTFIQRAPPGLYSGQITGVVGARTGRLTFRTELRGNGATGLDAGLAILLQCCGFKLATLTYSPTLLVTEQKTCTISLAEDGRLKKMTGCMGNPRLLAEQAGGIAYLEFDMQGVWVAPTDAALASPAPSAAVPMRWAGTTLTLGAYHPKPGRLAISLGAKVVGHQNPENASGYDYFFVSDNDATVEFDPESELVATHDYFGLWTAGTPAALTQTFSDGTVDVTIAAPVLQYRRVETGDRDDRLVESVVGQCLYSAGNDQLTIVSA